jgi:DNA helicase IV
MGRWPSATRSSTGGWRRTRPESRASSATRRSRRRRVLSLAPELAKGLEFDLVVLVDPQTFGTGTQGAVDRYVAMTRATQELVILSGV